MTNESETLTNSQLSHEIEFRVVGNPESPAIAKRGLTFATGMAGLACSLYLIYFTTRLLFPELVTEYIAADLRPQLVTIVAWIIFGVMILISLLTLLKFAFFQGNFVRALLVVCAWVGCYAWLSLASSHVEQVYYRWAFDSYECVTFSSSSRGVELFDVDGEIARDILQLPVSILEPNGIRVVMFLVVASLAGFYVWAFSDD